MLSADLTLNVVRTQVVQVEGVHPVGPYVAEDRVRGRVDAAIGDFLCDGVVGAVGFRRREDGEHPPGVPFAAGPEYVAGSDLPAAEVGVCLLGPGQVWEEAGAAPVRELDVAHVRDGFLGPVFADYLIWTQVG